MAESGNIFGQDSQGQFTRPPPGDVRVDNSDRRRNGRGSEHVPENRTRNSGSGPFFQGPRRGRGRGYRGGYNRNQRLGNHNGSTEATANREKEAGRQSAIAEAMAFLNSSRDVKKNSASKPSSEDHVKGGEPQHDVTIKSGLERHVAESSQGQNSKCQVARNQATEGVSKSRRHQRGKKFHQNGASARFPESESVGPVHETGARPRSKQQRPHRFYEQDANQNEYLNGNHLHAAAVEGSERSNQNQRKKNNVQTLGSRKSSGKTSRGSKTADNENLRERLTQQLASGQYECMVCLEKVKPAQATWNCKQCYQIFHIFCIKKWSKAAIAESGMWRCPGCQTTLKSTPVYSCFCEKTIEPAYNRSEVPHSCGEVCGQEKKSFSPDCPHVCTELCHPGPCPPCTASVLRTCPCDKTQKRVKCGTAVTCAEICGKPLNCGVHNCRRVCHEGSCEDCDEIISLKCFCSRCDDKEVPCGKMSMDERASNGFSCGKVCDKELACGNHRCAQVCHAGPCNTCVQSVELIRRCPCGKKSLDDLGCVRQSCLDPIPSCGEICRKKLNCGPVGNNHECKEICHSGPCPPCNLTTKVQCRCGNMIKDIPCAELTSRADDAVCEKKCTKWRNCGRHKCGNNCCIDLNHVCDRVCGKLLTCGLHRCDRPCHVGNCDTCYNVSFDELRCYCGSSVIYPPIPCGTKPPPCSRPCTREHSCGHEVRHSCHSDPACPPCAALTEKRCYGGHELRKNVPCHLEGISCGRPCGLPLPCGRHHCIRPCHQGPCVDASKNEKCTQPCTKIRPSCGHQCNVQCHEGDCPNTPCNEKVKITCACGHLQSTTSCSKNESEFRRLNTALLAAKMADLKNGSTSVEIGDLCSSRNAKSSMLECNEECAQLERNRRLASALQLENPDLSNRVIPKYSDFLKDYVKKDVSFAQDVHDKLSKLVKLAKESKQKSRSFSFDCMNREKRQFIHEYAEHFAVTTESFDAEPKRNVIATALKEKATIPFLSVMEAALNSRKALGPVRLDDKSRISTNTLQTLQPLSRTTRPRDDDIRKSPIDYFDFDG